MPNQFQQPGVTIRHDKCLRCGVDKVQNRKDQKLRPGRWPCLTGGSHRFTERITEPKDARSRA
ncbi:hypothetical protein FDH58_gp28 [Arthrobacter phage HunterDalle]|uniref:Uncharacterized protein n=6 Tax=Korravirus hunterdalle TaxID=1982080 RepID=A0A3G8FVI2_9CAUD|nr:hypothetical protein FDH58_gp28 [Arthrobacter phage HunterDalle]ALY10693.1 hypothetical protein VULTURE_28 [Arthrobacter phage Vulture]AZF98685.1 hypothetical protein SEA_ALEDEL_28 [Arthrobacter phage Aledel]AZS07748.1 hypothetical protein SEA_EUNOIA_28 [Arthrobacter phage Eunoia]AZS09208.1 hypothetical protein SEA_OMALLEY_28 [Arthrobacter phage OMalley]AZS09690.1 hypothetical protein SEA_RIOVINA_28 [Arthrobacter phage Riovina]AZS10438.1 hypothetical protein SEA_SUPAKEV_28 [Arthrobacter ph